MESVGVAELFLIEFVKTIIGSKAPSTPIKENTNSDLMQASIMVKDSQEPKPAIPQVLPVQKVMPQIQIKKPSITYSTESNLSATDKLNILLKDPYVNEIECIGADQPLKVKKSGSIQNTKINMSIDEIYELIAEFSQKTRIPVINGKIKAALNDLIITAVLSETLGPKFIIQKRKSELII